MLELNKNLEWLRWAMFYDREDSSERTLVPGWLQVVDNCRGICGHSEERKPRVIFSFGHDDDSTRPR